MTSEENQKLDCSSIDELTSKRLREFEIERQKRVIAKARDIVFPVRFKGDANKDVEKERT